MFVQICLCAQEIVCDAYGMVTLVEISSVTNVVICVVIYKVIYMVSKIYFQSDMVTLTVTGNAFLSLIYVAMGFFLYMVTVTSYTRTVALVIYMELDLIAWVDMLVEELATLVFCSSVFCSSLLVVVQCTHFHDELHQ